MENQKKLNNELLKKHDDEKASPPKRNSKQELINKIVQVAEQNDCLWNCPIRNFSDSRSSS